ncbi:putative membrane protein [Campylobacter blaseri]|nr:hypothetical protein [Campylobacter blaseri]QKF85787.1 putative membrane protein [Campylobacter blaseri]
MKFKKTIIVFLVFIAFIKILAIKHETTFFEEMGWILFIYPFWYTNLFFKTISDLFNNITTSYPILFLIVLFVISLLILYLILKRFFKKQKIILSFTILIILTLIFVRAVPDYSNKYGISLTTIFKKEKYKQGYCLKEDRILPKEELYRKAVFDYIEKYKILNEKIDYFMHNCSKNTTKDNKYYIYENFTIDNWEEYLRTNINNENFFSNDNLKVANLDELFQIDTKTNIAGFKKPVIYTDMCKKRYEIYLNNSLIFSEEGIIKTTIDIQINSKDYYKNKSINKIIDEHKEIVKKKNRYSRKIDNCGNVNYSIDKEVASYLEDYFR